MRVIDPGFPLGSCKILVVDDQHFIRDLLTTAFTDAGAEVWCAADGAEALKLLEQRTPELILLDLAMPGLNGWQVLEALRAMPGRASIPVVLETSATDFDAFNRARSQGVAAFISKPFLLDEVIETCRRILKGARPLQGKPARDEVPPSVEARDRQGTLLATGGLLDLGGHGAQVELDCALPLAGILSLTIFGPDGKVTKSAEVRWVSRTGERFQHGLLFRE
jgi:CheY-like chemotaxis protein